MSDGLVHIATYDGLVHSPDPLTAAPPGHFEAGPPGHVEVPPAGHIIVLTPPADSVIHVINEGVIGHFINQVV